MSVGASGAAVGNDCVGGAGVVGAIVGSVASVRRARNAAGGGGGERAAGTAVDAEAMLHPPVQVSVGPRVPQISGYPVGTGGPCGPAMGRAEAAARAADGGDAGAFAGAAGIG